MLLKNILQPKMNIVIQSKSLKLQENAWSIISIGGVIRVILSKSLKFQENAWSIISDGGIVCDSKRILN